MAKRMTDSQVFDFLEGEHPGLFFRVKELKVGDSLDVEGFIIIREDERITKIVRPDWCIEIEKGKVQ